MKILMILMMCRISLFILYNEIMVREVNSGIFIVFLFLNLAMCSSGKEGDEKEAVAFALTERNSGQGEEILNPSGPFMTSPVWLPDGSGLVTRGYGGRGIFLLKTTGAGIESIHPNSRKYIEWREKGKSFCIRSEGGAEIFEYDPSSGKFLSHRTAASTCSPGPDPYSTERVLHQDESRSIIHDIWIGSVKIISGDGEVEIERAGAWGVTASPEGQKIAYCLGHLKNASLTVFDLERGKNLVGRGVHPAWFPGGRFLIYAGPEASSTKEERITYSELFLYDTGLSVSTQLTDTPGVVEMQPGISPSGSEIVFSDWKSGSITVAPAPKEVGP